MEVTVLENPGTGTGISYDWNFLGKGVFLKEKAGRGLRSWQALPAQPEYKFYPMGKRKPCKEARE